MAHQFAVYRCSYCCEIPDVTPLFRCPNRHHYCEDCYRKLQELQRGCVEDIATCLICEYTGSFIKSEVTPEFLIKLKMKPGIGRPCRYVTDKPNDEEQFRNINATTDYLFGYRLETFQGDSMVAKSSKMIQSVNYLPTSKQPLTCLHDGCKKSVAIGSLVDHYKHDHGMVPLFGVEKGKELKLLFDVSLVEHDRTLCLAMITVYDCTKIDVVRSKCSQSVINACERLSGKVPLNTFWLMMSGSSDHTKATSYVVYWLYSNSEEKYWCTMELSSAEDQLSISTFCRAVGLHEGCSVHEVAKNMNCLFVNYGTFVAFLAYGDKINLRISLH